jgi:hypothetical protein
MINELLQKELLSYATSKNTWRIDPDSTDDVQPFENWTSRHSSKTSYSEVAAAGGKWIPVVHSFNKKKKTPTVSAMATEQSHVFKSLHTTD